MSNPIHSGFPMTDFSVKRCAGILVMIAVLLFGRAENAAAFDESAWHQAAHSRVRLISNGDVVYPGRNAVATGLEIVLDRGWKTYWRTPGDGLAPSIDWRSSENVKQAEILWPAPKRLDGPGGLTSYGYEDRVVLPILVTPAEGASTAILKLNISYGVCADICIPVEIKLELGLPPSTHSDHQNTLRAALKRVPKEQKKGVYCPHSFITAKRRTVNGTPALLIKTAFEDAASGLDLFVERRDGLELPPPERQPRASRGRLYHILSFESEEAVNELKGQNLLLTMVSDQGSCETAWRVK